MTNKLNKKAIILISSMALAITIFVPRLAYASGFTDTICNMIGAVICFFADGIVWLCDNLGGQFDKLLFNYNGDSVVNDFNLTVLKGQTLSTQIISIYKMMQYIATVIFLVIGVWITIDFVRTADNPQHKTVLIDRLKKLLLAIVLLTSISVILDVMLAINYGIADTFRMITKEFTEGSSVDYGKSFLTEIFKGLYDKGDGSEALVYSLVYLISSFINLWLIIFYMIRDLGISFLLILAPIIVCLLPYRTDLFVSWFKEMASNIFTQSIQAMIFTVVIAIVSGLDGNSDLYAQIFALVAFAMFIPMTASIKRMIGLEGNIGSAKSNAGLGTAIMGAALASKTLSGVKGKAGILKDSHERIKDLKSERDNLEKNSTSTAPLQNYNKNAMSRGMGNLSTVGMNTIGSLAIGGTDSGMNMGDTGLDCGMATMATIGGRNSYNKLGNVNTNGFDRNKDTINGEIKSIRRQTFKSMGAGIGSSVLGGAMAIGASGLGPMGAFAGMQMGNVIGETAGIAGTNVMSKVGTDISEFGQDMAFGKGIRPDTVAITNGNKNWNLNNAMSNLSNMKKNMNYNLSNMKSDMKYSEMHSLDENDDLYYEKQARQDEGIGLTGDPIQGTEYYQDEKDSRMQTQKLIRNGEFAKASRYRMQTSIPSRNLEAINAIESTSGEAMLYTDDKSSILYSQNSESGERKILATFEGNPNLTTPTMETVSFGVEGDMPISEAQRSGFREQAVEMAINTYGSDSISDNQSTYYETAQKFIDKETNNLINKHMSRNQSIRNNTGNPNIIISGNPVEYNNVPANNQPIETQVKVDIPNNIENQHSQNVYTNIEVSKMNITNKATELMQQQQYTESMKQGLDELNAQYKY
ncbi:hypothetical protein FDA52_05130 [Clostridium botulinum]|nr:hypothetical protein [Clostridium botulinum]